MSCHQTAMLTRPLIGDAIDSVESISTYHLFTQTGRCAHYLCSVLLIVSLAMITHFSPFNSLLRSLLVPSADSGHDTSQKEHLKMP